jgi:CRP/FNR family cyclic AMP-dependent transcriptional regulator
MLTTDQAAALKAFDELFLRHGTQYTYRKGEFIIRPGETPSGIFYIESGLVKAYDITKYGEENMLIIRRQQEVFPLIWAITGQERNVIYEAMIPTTARLIKRRMFQTYLDENPDAVSILLDMAIEMYRIHSERILSLGYRNVRERLVAFLLSTASRFGIPQEGHTLLDVPLRHQDIGSSINASRETVGREIQALERKGLISIREGYICLVDLAALQDLL